MRGRKGALPPRRPRSTLHRPPVPDAPAPSPLPDTPPRSLREAITLIEKALDAAGVPESIADARLLTALALHASPTWIFTHDAEPMPEAAWPRLRDLVSRRCAREPLQHISGVQEFFGLRIGVGPEVLIPRPETELIVERLIAALREAPFARIGDVGTGSGCIAVAAASEIHGCRVIASDVSAEALARARANAAELGLESRITFVEGDLGEPLREHAPFHALASNLPYITTDELATLEPEVRDFEPHLALDGGADGLDLVRRLLEQAPDLLAPGGLLVLEVGHEHGARVAQLMRDRGFDDVRVHRDLAGVERVVEGRLGRP